MIDAILFDMGGTLDGDGLHWLDRFERLYASAGATLAHDRVRSAFDAAERRAASDPDIARAGFERMIERHVSWQLAHLERADRTLHDHLVNGFIEPARACARRNVQVLAELAARGLRLGVVSNGCGNVDVLCADFGYAPYLSVVVDSRRAGVAKPDPAIFALAAQRLGLERSAIMMVGDSFDRDVRPAKAAGLLAAWLEGEIARECPDPSLVDLRLRRLVDLPASIPATARDVA
jgi:putative hydrolase of the HAD superfamily